MAHLSKYSYSILYASAKQNDGSVLLDVTLQVRCDDGTPTTVAPENFPAEGVEVLLP